MSALSRLASLLAEGQNLNTFAFEFRRTYGRLMPAGCCRYDTLVQVAGMGIVRETIFASTMDSSAETGVWQTRVSDPELMRNLAQATIDARLDKVPAYHVEPGDMMYWIRVAAGDNRFDTFLLSGDHGPHQELLAPIRTALSRMLDEAVNSPVRTLRLELEIPDRLPRGKVRAPVQLTFHNSGSQSHWVRNPYSQLEGEADANDVRRIVYRLAPPASPKGPTPMPAQPLYASLEVAPENSPPKGEDLYVLLQPNSAMTFEFIASFDLTKPGRYYFEAQYGAFASSEAIDGTPRWAGCAGSNRAELNIS